MSDDLPCKIKGCTETASQTVGIEWLDETHRVPVCARHLEMLSATLGEGDIS